MQVLEGVLHVHKIHVRDEGVVAHLQRGGVCRVWGLGRGVIRASAVTHPSAPPGYSWYCPPGPTHLDDLLQQRVLDGGHLVGGV